MVFFHTILFGVICYNIDTTKIGIDVRIKMDKNGINRVVKYLYMSLNIRLWNLPTSLE